MPEPVSRPNRGRKVLLFGSQALAFDKASANQLRSTLLNMPALDWVLGAITDLPRHWDALCKAVPTLRNIPGARLLEDLKFWIETGKFKEASFPLPNIILTPLVVITHLTQYEIMHERDQLEPPKSLDFPASTIDNVETVGLCTGLLSAAAVSCSEDLMQLHRHSAVAIRLAMIVGALADAEDKLAGVDGASKSFSVAWSSPEIRVEIEKTLKRFPDVRSLQELALIGLIHADPLCLCRHMYQFS